MSSSVPFTPALTSRLWATFPPFFTVQPNDTSRHTQLEEWSKILLTYCSTQKTTLLAPLIDWPWWENRMLSRTLPVDGIEAVAQHLIKKKRAEWGDAAHTTLRVFFKTVEELAPLVLDTVRQYRYIDDFKTLDEITGEFAFGKEFENLDHTIMTRVLELLRDQGYCVMTNAGGVIGVKFLEKCMRA